MGLQIAESTLAPPLPNALDDTALKSIAIPLSVNIQYLLFFSPYSIQYHAFIISSLISSDNSSDGEHSY